MTIFLISGLTAETTCDWTDLILVNMPREYFQQGFIVGEFTMKDPPRPRLYFGQRMWSGLTIHAVASHREAFGGVG